MTPPENTNDDENSLIYPMIRVSQLKYVAALIFGLSIYISLILFIVFTFNKVPHDDFNIFIEIIIIITMSYLIGNYAYNFINREYVFNSKRPLTITKDFITFYQTYKSWPRRGTLSWNPLQLNVSEIDNIVLVGLWKKTSNPNEPLMVVPFARMEFLMKYNKLIALELGNYKIGTDLRTVVRFFNQLNIPVLLVQFHEYDHFMEKYRIGLVG